MAIDISETRAKLELKRLEQEKEFLPGLLKCSLLFNSNLTVQKSAIMNNSCLIVINLMAFQSRFDQRRLPQSKGNLDIDCVIDSQKNLRFRRDDSAASTYLKA